MKLGLLALAMGAALAPSPAAGASLEAQYLAARHAFIEKIGKIKEPQEQEREADRAAKELQERLRHVIGPIAIKSLAPGGPVNTLIPGDGGSNDLDGLIFTTPDENSWVLVTTRELLQHWLKSHADIVGRTSAPDDVLLKAENFYTQAHFEDAAVQRYVEIPIAKLAGATFAYAMLVTRTNDGIKSPPNEIALSVVRGTTVFVASAPLKTKIEPIAACEQLWAGYEAKWAAKGTREGEEKADAAYRRCFANAASRQPFFAPLTSEAQSLVDLLPTR